MHADRGGLGGIGGIGDEIGIDAAGEEETVTQRTQRWRELVSRGDYSNKPYIIRCHPPVNYDATLVVLPGADESNEEQLQDYGTNDKKFGGERGEEGGGGGRGEKRKRNEKEDSGAVVSRSVQTVKIVINSHVNYRKPLTALLQSILDR